MDTSLKKNTYYTISLNLITEGDFETDASKNMFFNTGMLDVPVKNSKSDVIYYVPHIKLDKEILKEALAETPILGNDLRNIFIDYNTFSKVIETIVSDFRIRPKTIEESKLSGIPANNLELIKSIFFPKNSVIRLDDHKYSILESSVVKDDKYKTNISFADKNRKKLQFNIYLRVNDVSLLKANSRQYSCSDKAQDLAKQSEALFGTKLGLDKISFPITAIKRYQTVKVSEKERKDEEERKNNELLKRMYDMYKYPGVEEDIQEVSSLEDKVKEELSQDNGTKVDEYIAKQKTDLIEIQKRQFSDLIKQPENKNKIDEYIKNIRALQAIQRKRLTDIQTDTISNTLFKSQYVDIDKLFQESMDSIRYSYDPTAEFYSQLLVNFYLKSSELENGIININNNNNNTKAYVKFFTVYRNKKSNELYNYIKESTSRMDATIKKSIVDDIYRINEEYKLLSAEKIVERINDDRESKEVLKEYYIELNTKFNSIKNRINRQSDYNSLFKDMFDEGEAIRKKIPDKYKKYLRFYVDYEKDILKKLYDYIMLMYSNSYDYRSIQYRVEQIYNSYKRRLSISVGGKIKRKTIKRKGKYIYINKKLKIKNKIYTYKKK
jgi:hypothetical protein